MKEIGNYTRVEFESIDEIKNFIENGDGEVYFYSVYDGMILNILTETDLLILKKENEDEDILEHSWGYADSRFVDFKD